MPVLGRLFPMLSLSHMFREILVVMFIKIDVISYVTVKKKFKN